MHHVICIIVSGRHRESLNKVADHKHDIKDKFAIQITTFILFECFNFLSFRWALVWLLVTCCPFGFACFCCALFSFIYLPFFFFSYFASGAKGFSSTCQKVHNIYQSCCSCFVILLSSSVCLLVLFSEFGFLFLLCFLVLVLLCVWFLYSFCFLCFVITFCVDQQSIGDFHCMTISQTLSLLKRVWMWMLILSIIYV